MSTNIQPQFNFALSSKATLDVMGKKMFSLTVQNYKIPRIYGYVAEYPSPKLTMPLIGNKMVYDILEVSFLVTENLESYLELHDWMRIAYAPTGTPEYDRENAYKDIILTIYSAQNNPILKVTYEDCFPVKIDEVIFDTQSTDSEPIKTKVDFAYKIFKIEKI